MTPPTDGLLLVDKPVGVSSHDVVNVARRALREKRIGHAGTLDPFATGLLVLLVGRATRLLPHVSGDPKVYEATIRFGTETDTEDLHGGIVRDAPLPDRDAVLGAIPALTGQVQQVPPAYSAKRVDGKRAYALARAGEEVVLPAIPVRVDRWEVLGWQGTEDAVISCDVRITCGGGTYIRSLARDLARAAGSAAHLTALRRTNSGLFAVSDAVTLDALREGEARLRSALDALPERPRQPLDARDVLRIARGLEIDATVEGPWGALTSADTGQLVALAERKGDRWQPRVVLRDR